MITKLRLGNFKAFADTQEIPIRPITLIFGPNSAGKSSIIHSLALAHEAMREGDLDVRRTELGGESIDLGGFRQYVYQGDTNRTMEWGLELDTAKFEGHLAELMAPVKTAGLQLFIGVSEATGVAVQSFAILADGEPILSASARGKGQMRVDQLNQKHLLFREILKAILLTTTTVQEVSEEDFAGMDEAVDELVPELVLQTSKFLPRMDSRSSEQQDTAEALLFPVSKAGRRDNLADAVRLFLPRALRELVNSLADLVEGRFDHLHYLGPLRTNPPRHLALAPNRDPNWKPGGGFAWDIIRWYPHVREAVNDWLGSLQTPYEATSRTLVSLEDLETQITEGLDRLNEHGQFEVEWEPDNPIPIPFVKDPEGEAKQLLQAIMDSDVHQIPDLVFVDKRNDTVVSHRDIGIGISQVLPVLVLANAFKNDLIAIEQPEIHLHPALQAELGDVFIRSALGKHKNTFLLETHSEHLILRILKRIRQTTTNELPDSCQKVLPTDVCVLYVEPTSKGARVIEIPVTEEGDFSGKWPQGFFIDRIEEWE